MTDTPAPAPVQFVQGTNGPTAIVELTVEEVLAYIPPDVLELAKERAKGVRLAALLFELQGEQDPPGPTVEDLADELAQATSWDLRRALDDANIPRPEHGPRKEFALLCAQHGIRPDETDKE